MVDKFDWQGSVGKEWSKRMDGLDHLLNPVGELGIAAMGNVKGKRVLDVGCGAGSTSRALNTLGADVTGVDISKDLLALAKEQGGAKYMLADASADPLPCPPQLSGNCRSIQGRLWPRGRILVQPLQRT